jgi:pimeloyl-[acyl-carrier protein] methyl ester esterase
LRAPQRVRGLILLAATPRFVQGKDWPYATPAATFGGFRDALLADPRTTLERFLALQVRGSEGARETLRTLRRELAGRPDPEPAGLAKGLDLLRSSDLRSRLAEVSCPVLWLLGERDTLVPAAAAETIADLVPCARVRVISGAGHAPFLSHPEESGSRMTDFLTELGW